MSCFSGLLTDRDEAVQTFPSRGTAETERQPWMNWNPPCGGERWERLLGNAASGRRVSFFAVALISQQRSAVNKTTVVWFFYTTATLKIYCLAEWGFTRCILIHADRAHQQMLINTHPADTIQDCLCWMLTSLIVKLSAQHCCLQWVLLDRCKHFVSETVERKFHHGSHSLRVLFSLSWLKNNRKSKLKL